MFTVYVIIWTVCVVLTATPAGASDVSFKPESGIADSRTYRVFVADYGYHTAIILEQPTNGAYGPPGRADAASSAFVEYAWGDRRFFMESRYAPWSLFTTLVLPSESVMYVNGWRSSPTTADGLKTVVGREVTRVELNQLIASLESYFIRARESADTGAARHDAAPRTPPYPAVSGYAGRFFKARGRYTALANCNRWTVERLSEAGLARTGGVVVTPAQAIRRLAGFSDSEDRLNGFHPQASNPMEVSGV